MTEKKPNILVGRYSNPLQGETGQNLSHDKEKTPNILVDKCSNPLPGPTIN